MDGSWSVGDEDFETAKHWLVNVTSGFDVSSHYTQVGVVQYSDTPRLEIPLGVHKTAQDLIKAIENIDYLGGNTQTGRAIKFAVDHVFASSQRSDVKNRIAVVVTDGKSQDDVVDASVEARAQGVTVFAVGVGTEITTSELMAIANKPAGDYVLYAEDYTNIDRIRDAMEQKLCEGKICIHACEPACKHWPHYSQRLLSLPFYCLSKILKEQGAQHTSFMPSDKESHRAHGLNQR